MFWLSNKKNNFPGRSLFWRSAYFPNKIYVVGTKKNSFSSNHLFKIETGSSEEPKHILKLMEKKIYTVLYSKIVFT